MTELNLASGASYFRSPAVAIAAAISALHQGKTYYGPAAGSPELRQAIADRYQHDGIKVKPEQVVVTPGTKQALFNLFSVLLREGDEVVIPTPAWFGFYELLKYTKGKLVTIETTPQHNYSLDAQQVRKALTSKSRILLLTNPANPTGRIYTKPEVEAMLALLQDYPDLYLISDEIYDLDTYGKPFTSALACQGPPERTIVVNGFSKNFAMSGWRIGYMVGPETIVAKCTDFQSSTFSGVSMFIQDAALATLQQQQNALYPMLPVLTRHRQLMKAGLEAIPHVRFMEPDGAYYFFPDLSYYIGSKTPAGKTIATTADLVHYLQQDYQLIVANGDLFGGKGHVRMSFAVEEQELVLALGRLQKALQQLIVA
ncbi:aminotransferase class I/II-fold pyridoxal phosphate-dependent enzyme [Pontibacter sp. Tf4]|uniref:aminotransferase class I/II-fold pyridoxal phosphate-dependent enzyme n=1 Tax=Pontibacter sp. Tf4 TaxID=2761620 RepID=UPI001629B2DD|nr:aminotransferase class I/II-fold pyridoxal phosphate-dependent enzyme [Pontibacter sp. Tf4]MBB6610036.1 aminotransferase class I/II-fold pyridoxal phosphate-dependent enzyme [Pontibacter sp. Tf4]